VSLCSQDLNTRTSPSFWCLRLLLCFTAPKFSPHFILLLTVICLFVKQEKLKAELLTLQDSGAPVPFVQYHREDADISFLQKVAATLPKAKDIPHLAFLTGGSLTAGMPCAL
jgi:hypothetical protein